MSRDMTKPTKWLCAQRRLRSAWVIRVFAVRMKKAWVLSYRWAHSEDSDQTGRLPRLIWVFAGRTLILFVFSCRGSNIHPSRHQTGSELTHICLAEPSMPIHWMSPFAIHGCIVVYFFIFILFFIAIHVSEQWRPWSGSALFAYVPKKGRQLIWVKITQLVRCCLKKITSKFPKFKNFLECSEQAWLESMYNYQEQCTFVNKVTS